MIGNGFELKVDPKAKVKAHTEYAVVGQSIARVDIPAKVSGEHPYVHDFKLPGMLHALDSFVQIMNEDGRLAEIGNPPVGVRSYAK